MGRVLLVNENARARAGDRLLLTRSGYRVLEASDVYDANDLLCEAEVDAVLLDAATEGCRLFAEVLGRFHPGVPVILAGNSPAGALIGAGTYHDRGAGPDALLRQVAQAVDRRHAAAAVGTKQPRRRPA